MFWHVLAPFLSSGRTDPLGCAVTRRIRRGVQRGGARRPRTPHAPRRNVQQICGSSAAFAAQRPDGSVVTWGDPRFGGDSSEVPGTILA